MKNYFLIPGYGIPKDILKDQPYYRYLGLVFNYIYQICLKTGNWQPIIIFCGGKTDVFKPQTRTEAGEMKKLFLVLAKREFVKNYTKKWQYKIEDKSLSTVENIIFTKEIIGKLGVKDKLYIFTEQTRQAKIKAFAKEVFVKKFQVIPLDFDLSINRYRDPSFIEQKEKTEKKIGLRAIKDQAFYKHYRQKLEKKIVFFRQGGAVKHQENINDWWKKEIKELENKEL